LAKTGAHRKGAQKKIDDALGVKTKRLYDEVEGEKA